VNETKYQVVCQALVIMAQRYKIACEALELMAQRYKNDMKEDKTESIFGVNERKIAALEKEALKHERAAAEAGQKAAKAWRKLCVVTTIEGVCLLVVVVLLIIRLFK
jgi:hypothetical protein